MAGWAGDKTGREPATELNELRRACARIIGADEETWPEHGNAPLAIAAAFAIRDRGLREARADAESARRELAELEAATVPGKLYAAAERELESARRECDRLRSVLWQIATDDDLVYMGCSDIPHCGGRTQGDPIHQPDCVIGVAQRALGIDNHGDPFPVAGAALSGEAPPEEAGDD